ncbi:ylyB [Symbiodinium natans]|uniref:YlyB protein n=1 Tax=Symbiodinium natans TaxID=878477 RepID=A0A812I8C0_9DINO|nr:ylyB [Symbiodinium natans]
MAPAQVASRRDFARRGVRDEDLPTIVAKNDIHEGLKSLDFSRSRLTAAGLECLLAACSFKSLRVVKLYKNALADDAAVSLTALCHKSPGLIEMHLSHNWFTSRGAKAIVDAALSAEKLQGLPPLWLRLERNKVEDPKALLEVWDNERRSICRVTDNCRRASCSLGLRVHLPHFTAQEAAEVPMQRFHRQDKAERYSISDTKPLRHLKRRPPESWKVLPLRCGTSAFGRAPSVTRVSRGRSSEENIETMQQDVQNCFMVSRSKVVPLSEHQAEHQEPVDALADGAGNLSSAALWLSCPRNASMQRAGPEDCAEMDDGLKHRVLDIAAAWEVEVRRDQLAQLAEVGKPDSDAESTEDPDASQYDDNRTLVWPRLRMDDCTRAQIINMVEEPEIDFDSEESEWDEPPDSDAEGMDMVEGKGDEAIADQSVVAAAMDAQEPRVVYSGDGFFVLFKPPKCVCEPPNTTIGVARYVHQMGIEDTDHAICHRLDLPTSGLLLVGSDPDVLDDLLRQRNARSWCKNYVCLMHGWLPSSQVEGTLQSKLRTEREGQGYRTFVDPEWGFSAITHYAALRHYRCRRSGRPFTLMMLRIITGRTHQIRVHIAELGTTAGLKTAGIAGDAKYLDSSTFAGDVALFQRASKGLAKVIEPRLCLHACSLGFRTSQSRSYLTVKCGLPSDMAAIINNELVEEGKRANGCGSLAESGSWILRELKAAAAKAYWVRCCSTVRMPWPC